MSDTAVTSFLGSCLDLLQTSLEVKGVCTVGHAWNPPWEAGKEGPRDGRLARALK